MRVELRQKYNEIFEPQLIAIGAIKKSTAIYAYENWLCYPTKGFAMNKKNQKVRMELQEFIDKCKRGDFKMIEQGCFCEACTKEKCLIKSIIWAMNFFGWRWNR